MYVDRTLESFFSQAASRFPVMLVTGARQVGKTTFLQHLSKESRAYVTLDDPLVLSLAKDDPALFRMVPPTPLSSKKPPRQTSVWYGILRCWKN